MIKPYAQAAKGSCRILVRWKILPLPGPYGSGKTAADVEGVDDVIESEPDRGFGQLRIIQFAAVTGPAGIQESAHRRRALPIFYLQVLFRGRNCGYGQVMIKLADGLYHRRRGADLLAGQVDPAGLVDAGAGRRWRPPNISSLSRARGKLGADPLRMLFVKSKAIGVCAAAEIHHISDAKDRG